MQKDSKIIAIVGAVIAVLLIGLVFYTVKSDAGPGPHDDFATALKDGGATFYGAFWCTHCQAQKKLFGKSAKLLPYVECATPDGSNQNQACNLKKVEGYPTWEFKNGLIATSNSEPTVCPVKAAGVKQVSACENTASDYFKVWLFPGYGFSIRSATDPVKTSSTTWQFASSTQTSGELPLDFLAKQINFTLP